MFSIWIHFIAMSICMAVSINVDDYSIFIKTLWNSFERQILTNGLKISLKNPFPQISLENCLQKSYHKINYVFAC